MFRQEDTNKPSSNSAHEPETIIGHSVKVDGNFRGDGNVIIEGEVKGSVKTKKDVKVGERAMIKASIDAANAFVAGLVQGNIKVKEKLELTASAHVTGDVSAKILQIHSGAKINGQIKMEDESLIEHIVEKKPEKPTAKEVEKPNNKTKKK
jgi:cytoskeletal protein CcmA (bactofilin family)